MKRSAGDKHFISSPTSKRNIFLLLTHFVMSHVGLGPVQQPLELQSIGVPIRYDVAHLAHNGGEDEHTDEVANYGENVPGQGKKGR